MSEISRNRTSQGSGRSTGSRSSQGRTGSSSTRTRSSSSRQSNSDRILAVQNARNLGSGTGSGRRSTSGNRRRGKRRRQGPDFAKILLIIIGIIILILCIAVGVKGCSRDGGDETSAEETTSEPETELEAEITVNGISVHGLTKTEAKEKVLDAMGWAMKVSYDGDTKEIPNLMEGNVEDVLTEAFEKGESGSYTVEADGLEDAVKAEVESLASGWDVAAKNGSISSYDSSSGQFVFSGAQNGKLIERDKLESDILAAVTAGDYNKTIEATATEVEPEITEAEAKANFKRLGTYTTTTTSNKDRNENIRIAAAALNGIIIQPGGEFSFNQTTGNRTTEKGYRPAGAYQNGVLVEEPGGGVCQVSSTLYNAVVFAGLKTTERHAHSYEPSYVTPGEDAMVSYDGYSGPDMRFVNNSKTAVGIKTSFSNQKLTVSIYGNPILEEGVTLSMKSEKVKELDPPAPVYEEDPTLEPGVEVEAKAATPGSRWVTNLVTMKDGKVVSEEFFHNSTYNGKSATIKRNTSGTVASTEGESSSGDSSAAEGETAESVSQPSETSAVQPGSQHGPGGAQEPSESSAQNMGPGDVIEPSNGGNGGTSGPAEQGPGFENGPGMENVSGGITPGQAETDAGPSDVGLISPMG